MDKISVWSPSFEPAKGGIEALSADVLDACSQEWDSKGFAVWSGPGRSIFAKLGFCWRAFLDGLTRRPQVVILMHVHLIPLAALLKKIFGFRLAVWLHGIEVWDGPGRREIHRADEVDLFIAISQVTVARTSDWRPPGRRCEIINPTADFQRFSPGPPPPALLRRHGFGGSSVVILTVGRLASGEGYKGHDAVIRSLPQVLQSVPNAIYLIVGTGDDRPRLEALANETGIANKVAFAGYVAAGELPDHYRLATVFAMPSGGEGFGIVFLEALASGCQVVAGNGDGAADALRGGKLGAMVDPQNIPALAEALAKALAAGRQEWPASELEEVFGRDRFRREVCASVKGLISCAG